MIRIRRMASRLVRVLAASAIVAAGANAALAMGIPDGAQLASMRAAVERSSRLKVRAADGSFLLNTPAVSEEGLSGLYGVTRRASITAIREEQRLVPWSRIERVESVSSGAGRGALYGAAAGLVLGVAIAADLEPGDDFPIPTGYIDRPPPISRFQRVATASIVSMTGAMMGSVVGVLFPRHHVIAP